jgi:hypothetical protein
LILQNKINFHLVYKIPNCQILLFYEYSICLCFYSSALLFFGQINEQNQEGLLDSIENPEIMRVLDLDSISLSKSSVLSEEVYNN